MSIDHDIGEIKAKLESIHGGMQKLATKESVESVKEIVNEKHKAIKSRIDLHQTIGFWYLASQTTVLISLVIYVYQKGFGK